MTKQFESAVRKRWPPIAKVLHKAGLYVSVVNALLVYKYGNNSIQKDKTDKLDAVKIANYCLDRWTALERYAPADQIRQTFKTCRQYDQYIKLKVNLKNNLISLSVYVNEVTQGRRLTAGEETARPDEFQVYCSILGHQQTFPSRKSSAGPFCGCAPPFRCARVFWEE